MAYDTTNIHTDFGQGNDFGHKDYTAAREAGISNERILDWLDENEGKLIGKNVKGGGGLYDEISSSGSGRDYRGTDTPETNTTYGWIGNENTYNKAAGYNKLRDESEYEYSPRVSEAKERTKAFKEKYVFNDPKDNAVFKTPSGINPQPQRNADGSIVGSSSERSKKATQNFLNDDYHLNLDNI